MLANWASAISRIGLLLAITIQLVSIVPDHCVASLEISPIDVDSDELPSNVVPLEYNVEMVFMNNKGKLGRGKVEILFKVGRSSQSVQSSLLCMMGKKCVGNKENDRLVLHLRHNVFDVPEIDDLVTSDSIDSARSRDGQRVQVKALQVNEYYRLLVVQLDRSLREGSFGTIKLIYRIKDAANELQSSKQNPLVHSYPGEVYRLFPCLDEPHLKSKVTLTVDQPDANTRIIANMEPESSGSELDWERVTFRQTPVAIPLHSLAFAFVPASKAQKIFYPIEGTSNRMVLVHGSDDQLGKSHYAMEFAASSVEWMEKYFKGKRLLPVNLNLVPLPAQSSQHIGLDAHAGLGFGAINEEFLLVDEFSSSVDRKTESAFEVALVVARQWFGTMMTPRTRADSWITEGLAGYMALRMVRELAPQLEVDQYFNSVMRQQVEGKSANRNRLRFVKGAQVIDTLRRDVAEGKKDFDSIVRKMFSGREDVSAGDLARAFATKKLDETKLLKIIQSRAKQCEQINAESASDPWIELDIQDRQLLVGHFQEDNLNLPVALKVKLSTADGSKQIVRDVKLDSFDGANSKTSFDLPSWFGLTDGATDWAIVSQDDNEALTNFRVRYSDKLLERLRKPVELGDTLLKSRERVDIVASEVDSLKVEDYKEQTEERLAKVVEMFAREQHPEVVFELLRAIEALNARASTRDFVSKTAGKYKHWMKDDQKTKAGEERLKSALLRLLARQGDDETIEWALKRYRETGSNKRLLGAQTEPIHELVARAGDWRDRNSLAYRLSEGKSREEQLRIFKELEVMD